MQLVGGMAISQLHLPPSYTLLYENRNSLDILFHFRIDYMYYHESEPYEESISFTIILLPSNMTRTIDLENESEFWDKKIYDIIPYDHLSVYIIRKIFLPLKGLPKYYFSQNSLSPQLFCSESEFFVFRKKPVGEERVFCPGGKVYQSIHPVALRQSIHPRLRRPQSIHPVSPMASHPSRGESEQGTCRSIPLFEGWLRRRRGGFPCTIYSAGWIAPILLIDEHLSNRGIHPVSPMARHPSRGERGNGNQVVWHIRGIMPANITSSLLLLPPLRFRDTTASGTVFARSLEADLTFLFLDIFSFFEFVFFEDEVGREGHGCIIIDFLRRCRYSHGRDMIDHI